MAAAGRAKNIWSASRASAILPDCAPSCRSRRRPISITSRKIDRYATWIGELYLERCQGCYTTQARNKRFNRKMELALRDLEFVSAAAAHLTGHPYPHDRLEEIWKEVLLYQFHDILPGLVDARL